ncbi:MAG: hypothetical protein Ta2F_17740 [Termitinemataceae bacterium]|nr:MAG: hypothetical protein Ta2F_17740 [Termitinemataceae bacterium]
MFLAIYISGISRIPIKILAAERHPISYKTLFGAKTPTLESSINRELAQLCPKLEIPVITCHAFRHSLGTHLLRNGTDIRYIQSILGHEKLSSTQIYTKVDKQDLKKSLDAYHPRTYVQDVCKTI